MKSNRLILPALFLLLLLLPLLGVAGYRLRLLTVTFTWIALAGSWNLLSGYTGYIDFGPVAYFGVGSYATALLMVRAGWPFAPAAVVGAFTCGFLAWVVGIPTLNRRGASFAIATFAFAEAIKQAVSEFDKVAGVEFFGGAFGLTLPMGPPESFFYYGMTLIMAAVLGITLFFERSRFGYGLRAIREAELSAEMNGVPTHRLKVRAYALSSALIGLIGGMEAYFITYITPDDVFSVLRTIQMVIMTLLGGMGTVWGPVIGASLLTLLSEVLGARFVYDYLIVVGVVIVAVTLVLPGGLMSLKGMKIGGRGLRKSKRKE
jgi:branched-chain amino acid transport system permease protein